MLIIVILRDTSGSSLRDQDRAASGGCGGKSVAPVAPVVAPAGAPVSPVVAPVVAPVVVWLQSVAPVSGGSSSGSRGSSVVAANALWLQWLAPIVT